MFDDSITNYLIFLYEIGLPEYTQITFIEKGKEYSINEMKVIFDNDIYGKYYWINFVCEGVLCKSRNLIISLEYSRESIKKVNTTVNYSGPIIIDGRIKWLIDNEEIYLNNQRANEKGSAEQSLPP